MPNFKKPKKDSKFDTQIKGVFVEAETLIIQAVSRIVRGNGTIETEVLPIVADLQTNFNRWSEYRVTEEYLRGTNQLDRKAIEPVLTSLERLKITDAQQNLNVMVTELSQAHIDEIVVSVNEAIAYNTDTISLFTDNLETTLVQPEEAIKNILSLGSDVTEAQKKAKLVDVFQNKGFRYFTDRGGNSRTLERYAETITRTEVAKAYNQGTINRGTELGITRFIRDENVDCCPDICEEHRGDIRDSTVSSQPPYLLLHPNCQGTREPLFDE